MVFVGLSGGVDSSVAAARLLEQGCEVVGVFIRVWQPDFLQCDWEQERLDAMRVAAHLGIPFLTCDAEEEYKREVGEYFVNEYLAGRTPNPDVMCNRHVKFGAFWRFARERGADFIATGHYAQVVRVNNVASGGGLLLSDERHSLGGFGRGGEGATGSSSNPPPLANYRLLRGKDGNKDQSYFLWTLTQDDLSHTLFPVGSSTKEEIRAEAKKRGLPTAVKKDSQGICFLGHVDIKDFLAHFTELEPGRVLDVRGEEIGRHDGALIYTLGQRHGFAIDSKTVFSDPYYVVAKDIETNTLIVDTRPPVIASGSHFTLRETSWVAGGEPDDGEFSAVVRYRQVPFPVKLAGGSDGLTVFPQKEVEKPPAGQSCVIYRGEEMLGGGVIN